MKNLKTFIILFLFTTLYVSGQNQSSGNNKNVVVVITQTQTPKPHFADMDEPVAMYNTVTEELSVTLDTVHYSDYTITLVSGLIEVDYYPFSPLVCLPTASMGDVVTTTSCLF